MFCRRKDTSSTNQEFMALPEFSDIQINAMRKSGVEVEVAKEDYNTKEWKDQYKPTEIESINLIEPEPMKGVSNIQEIVRTKVQTGNMYQVVFGWRGKMMMVKLFFPDSSVPSRQKVAEALEKMYPGAQLRSYSHSVVDYDDPFINVGE